MELKKSNINNNNIQKLILTFQHYQTRSQLIFLSGYWGSKCQARKKWVVSAVPNGKPVVTGYFGNTDQLDGQYPLFYQDVFRRKYP